MRLFGITVGLCALLNSAAYGANVRSVFKGQYAGRMQQFSFGLDAKQIQSIYDLTEGKVNFGDVYYIDHSPSRLVTISQRAGFAGTIYPDVPPPAFVADPSMNGQWWIERTGVPAAWKMASGQGVTLADCDAGYYHDESDIHTNLLLNHRYDFSDKDLPYVINDGEAVFHGTAVVAIMSGVLDGVGTNGIAYNSEVVPFQNYNYDEKIDDLDKEEATARCILRAIKTPGVNIILLENQTEDGSSETFVGTRDAVRLALQAGIIVVGAAGNYEVELKQEKKDDTGSIIVGALGYNDSFAKFTNFGSRLTVGAYGEYLYTLWGPNGHFADFGGTSGAAPQVAAAVALMLEVNPFLTPAQARQILRDTRELTAANSRGGGKLRVDRAVARAKRVAPLYAEWNEAWLFRQRLTAILN